MKLQQPLNEGILFPLKITPIGAQWTLWERNRIDNAFNKQIKLISTIQVISIGPNT
jgi:hypothetical protein